MSSPMEEIPKMSDAELEKYLESAPYGSMPRNRAIEEHTRRKLSSISKPHWTLVPTFWLVVASVIIALVALFLALRADILAVRSSPESVPAKSQSLNSERAVEPQTPMPQPAPSRANP